MSHRIQRFIEARDKLDEWEDEHLEDSEHRDALDDVDHDSWYDFIAGESKLFSVPKDIDFGPNAECLDYLFRLLSEERWFIRRNAAKWLGEVISHEVIEPLIKALGDDNPDVRYAAARSLGRIGAGASIEALRKLLTDPNEKVEKVKRAVRTALERIEMIGLPSDIQVGQNDGYRKYLLRLLDDKNWVARRYASEWLGSVGTQQDIEPLVKALTDENAGVRYMAAKALSKVGDESAIEPLRRLSCDPASTVRGAASGAIIRLKS